MGQGGPGVSNMKSRKLVATQRGFRVLREQDPEPDSKPCAHLLTFRGTGCLDTTHAAAWADTPSCLVMPAPLFAGSLPEFEAHMVPLTLLSFACIG